MNPPPDSWTERLALPRAAALLLMALGLVLLAADSQIDKHGHFSAENAFGFYPLCGLLATVLIVLTARCLRPVLQREVTYYAEPSSRQD